MARSMFIVVSDDQSVVQKAQQYGQLNGVAVQVWSSDQYDSAVNAQSNGGSVPSLVSGNGPVETAKVLPFPGMSTTTVIGIDTRHSVATINQLEATAIENAIVAFKGNLTEAAKALGIGRATLYRKVKQYNIDPSVARNKKKAA